MRALGWHKGALHNAFATQVIQVCFLPKDIGVIGESPIHKICTHNKFFTAQFSTEDSSGSLAKVFMSGIEGVLGGISVSSSVVFVDLC